MRICHVTSHLPPDQAANALLPMHLGAWTLERGDQVHYLAHPPRAGAPSALPGPATWIPARTDRKGRVQACKLASLVLALRIARRARPVLASADVVHVHSSGLLSEVAGLLAWRYGRPVVLTLYGTEIWHYGTRRRFAPDLFTPLYRKAACVTFYSHGLLQRARELGLDRPNVSVVYPPVPEAFRSSTPAERSALREALGVGSGPLLLNVKRLHPLAGQRFLIEALPEIVSARPDVRLVICGSGPLRGELEAAARRAGVASHVTFAGLVPNEVVAQYCRAADLFVLPSLLEALPTVAVEALACGTRVVTTDTPGGIELGQLFGTDIAVVPAQNAPALAAAIIRCLHTRARASEASDAILTREFRPAAVAARFQAIYRLAQGRIWDLGVGI